MSLRKRLDHQRAQPLALHGVEHGRGGFLDHLLVPALQGAVALAQMHDAALAVADHLHLDVARMVEEALDIDPVVAERGAGLVARHAHGVAQLVLVPDHRHAAPAATRHRLDQHGKADLVGELDRLGLAADRPVAAGDGRDAELPGRGLGDDLVAHQPDMVG